MKFYIYNKRNKGYYRERDGVWTMRQAASVFDTRLLAQQRADAMMRSPKLVGLLFVVSEAESLAQARML